MDIYAKFDREVKGEDYKRVAYATYWPQNNFFQRSTADIELIFVTNGSVVFCNDQIFSLLEREVPQSHLWSVESGGRIIDIGYSVKSLSELTISLTEGAVRAF